MADCQHRIGSVNGEKDDIREVFCGEDESTEGEKEYKRDRNRADIAGKAFGTFTEVEVAEYQHTKRYNVEERLVDKTECCVEVNQRNEYGERIASRYAVNAVHKVVCVDDTDADDEGNDDHPPIVKIQYSKLIEHHKHRHKLHYEARTIGQRVYVIDETDASDKRQANQEPRVI